MTNKAIRRANPVFVAMAPKRPAPKRNHGVSFANPLNATLNGTTPRAQ
jgi:hypothetical protein